MTREEMMEEVSSLYGLEAMVTIAFCEIATTWQSDEAVQNMYDIAMKTLPLE